MRSPFRSALVAAAAALCCVGSLLAAPSADATGHKISSDSVADPGFSRFGSSYYVYGTGPRAQNVPIYTGSSITEDFALEGYAFRPGRLEGYSAIWAPHVVRRDGRYFMFFTASLNGGRHCLYSAVSSTNKARSYSSPTLLLCAANRRGESWEAIDPSTYTEGGDTYLVWRSGHIQPDFPIGDYQIRAAKLSFSGSSVTLTAGSPRIKLLGVENETVVEAPDIIAYAGKVYLFVSRGDFRNSSYRTDVYIADSIHSEFRFLKNLMSSGQGFGSGPGGAEVLEGSGSGPTYIAWHFRNKKGERHTRIGVVQWDKSSPVAAYVPSVV